MTTGGTATFLPSNSSFFSFSRINPFPTRALLDLALVSPYAYVLPTPSPTHSNIPSKYLSHATPWVTTKHAISSKGQKIEQGTIS